FIPFIMVALLGAGWIIMVAEAMLAAVVYPFLYIRMDGQDLFDNPQKPGLILIFNIFLRPTLGIGAFCFTFYLLPPIYDFLREHMLNAFFAQSVSSGRVVGGGG